MSNDRLTPEQKAEIRRDKNAARRLYEHMNNCGHPKIGDLIDDEVVRDLRAFFRPVGDPELLALREERDKALAARDAEARKVKQMRAACVAAKDAPARLDWERLVNAALALPVSDAEGVE